MISPYVIFGEKMEDRAKLLNPWENLYKMMSFNRFLNIDRTKGLSWGNISKNHVYGFNCFVRYLKKEIEVTERGRT